MGLKRKNMSSTNPPVIYNDGLTNRSLPVFYFNEQKWTLQQPQQSVMTQASQSAPTRATQSAPTQATQSVPTQNPLENLKQQMNLLKQNTDLLKQQIDLLTRRTTQATQANQVGLGRLQNQLNQASTIFAPTFINQATKNTFATSHVIQTDIDYEKMIEEFESELSKIVGLEELKLQLRKWSKGLLMDIKRRAMGIELGLKKAPHMAFLGNPGTGKTTVARVLGKLLHSVGVLSSDKVTEVQRSDLVGGYQGHTALKTRTKIIEATGGVLFVDEAYRLVPEYTVGKTDVGLEALEEIMSVLEDGDLVVIFAGYTEPMKRVFSSNAGFCRRVTHFYEFNDFSCDELTEMVMIKMNKQDKKSPLFGFKLHPLCTFEAIRQVIENNSSDKLRSKMNGGLVDHMLNNAKENLDSRLSINTTATVDEIMTITVDDLLSGLQLLSKSIKF